MASFLVAVVQALGHILSAPFRDLSVLWQITPIILMWLVLEVYFGKWDEELGWNSGLANALTLFWIIISTLQSLFGKNGTFAWPIFLVLLAALLYAISLMIIVFRHAVRDKYAFLITHPILIYSLCILVVLWANRLLELSWAVALAILFLVLLFFLLDLLLKKLLGHQKADWKAEDPFGGETDSDSFATAQRPTGPPAGLPSGPPVTAPQMEQRQGTAYPPAAPAARRPSPFRRRGL